MVAKFGRVMALDVGDARVGVALSDELRITGQPYGTVERDKGERAAGAVGEIVRIAREFGVTEVVFGLPKELSGDVGTQAKKVLEFVAEFEKAAASAGLEVATAFIDERFTTEEAKRVVVGSGLKNRDQRAALDRVSAAIMLRTYLERNG